MKFQKLIDTKYDITYDWMLVLSSVEEVMNFCELSLPPKVHVAWENLIDVQRGRAHVNSGMASYIHMSIESGESLLTATPRLLAKLIEDKIECVNKYGKIYINKSGGYFPHHSDDIKVLEEYIINNDSIIFPSYSDADIKVVKWEGGKHYYAYVGDIWVKPKDGRVKFNTSKEAEDEAKHMVYKLNQKTFEIKE